VRAGQLLPPSLAYQVLAAQLPRPGLTTPEPNKSHRHKTVCHGRGEYARDEDGDGFCEVHVNTMEEFWSALRSWLRPHRGISPDKLPLYLGFFQFVHNARRRGKALLGALIAGLVA
jgi:transposase